LGDLRRRFLADNAAEWLPSHEFRDYSGAIGITGWSRFFRQVDLACPVAFAASLPALKNKRFSGSSIHYIVLLSALIWADANPENRSISKISELHHDLRFIERVIPCPPPQ
jgi:hypothetical protein